MPASRHRLLSIYLRFDIWGMPYKVAYHMVVFWNGDKHGRGASMGGGAYIYRKRQINIVGSLFHSHVYPSDIFNQHVMIDTQPLTPTNHYNLMGINYPPHII